MVRNLRYKIVYLLYKFFYAIFRLMPRWFSKVSIDFVAYLVFKLFRKYYKISLANLDLVYKNSLTKKEKDKIILKSYRNLGYNMYELLENQHLSRAEILSKMKIINPEIIQNALDEKRKIIFVTAHYGGWEITLPGVSLYYDMQVSVVNKKMQNPYIHKIYASIREKNNITMIDKHSAAKGMLKTLKNSNQVAIVIDQYTDDGVEIEFLGIKENATDGVARLAIKLNALIIPILTTKNEFRNYEITIYDPFDPKKLKNIENSDKIYELTKLQNDIISAQILKAPEFWLWQHRRFRKYHSEIYI